MTWELIIDRDLDNILDDFECVKAEKRIYLTKLMNEFAWDGRTEGLRIWYQAYKDEKFPYANKPISKGQIAILYHNANSSLIKYYNTCRLYDDDEGFPNIRLEQRSK